MLTTAYDFRTECEPLGIMHVSCERTLSLYKRASPSVRRLLLGGEGGKEEGRRKLGDVPKNFAASVGWSHNMTIYRKVRLQIDKMHLMSELCQTGSFQILAFKPTKFK